MASTMVLDPKQPPSTLPSLTPDPTQTVTLTESEDDLYTRLKTLSRQIEFIEIQEEYVKDEQKNLKRELLRSQEEVKRIQSVPLVIGQFMEMIDQNNGIVGSTTGSNYYVRILSTINRELLKPSASVALHRHSNALVDVLPPEADSSISLLSQSEKPDVTYTHDDVSREQERSIIANFVENLKNEIRKCKTVNREAEHANVTSFILLDPLPFLHPIDIQNPTTVAPNNNQPPQWHPHGSRSPISDHQTLPSLTPDPTQTLTLTESEDDLYTRLKTLSRQIEFIEIQEEYVKDEQKNLKRELLRSQEEVKRIQSVPLVIGQFMEMIDQNNGIVGSTTGSNYYVRILSTINRELLKPSASVALHRHSNALVDVLPPEADSSISLLSQSEKPDVTYSMYGSDRIFIVRSEDIGGCDIQKQEIREAVELPLTHHELYKQIGIDPPRGVLLYGPPGTGKTMLAKAVANHTTAAFIRVVGSEFVQKYLGE
ncbi:26S proteasome regulatory subunit 6B, partial [Tanacetum coccineum]